MFRNYFAAALRNLVRNRLYAAINIIGLAVGFAAALLIALFVNDEYSYERWIPGYERTYLLVTTFSRPERAPERMGSSLFELAAPLQLDFPEIQAVARIYYGFTPTLRHGGVEATDNLIWADPSIFTVLPMRALAGNPATALEQPDGIVLTRKLARKYFGRDDPIGETIEINRQYPMQVRAIIDDLPSNTHLPFEAVASGRASFSRIADEDSRITSRNEMRFGVATYVRLAAGTDPAEIQNALPDFVKRHKDPEIAKQLSFELVPISEIHLDRSEIGDARPGSRATIFAFVLVGVLIVALAVFNFINLMTARAGRRAVEIGVRKVSGAQRRDLIVQFIGEAFLYVCLASTAALALGTVLMPVLNAYLQRTIASPFVQSPAFLAGFAATAAVTAALAGFYPALVLSAFRPAAVLKGARHDGQGVAQLRQILVVLQFAALIGLALVAAIIYQQFVFAAKQSLRMDIDQVVMVGGRTFQRVGIDPGFLAGCNASFRESVAALPGVQAVVCSSGSALSAVATNFNVMEGRKPDDTAFQLSTPSVDHGFFSFYGVRPIAGRVFESDRNDPVSVLSGETDTTTLGVAVINQSAALEFGFTTPTLAVGQFVELTFDYGGKAKTQNVQILGVIPDFGLNAREVPLLPAAYFLAPTNLNTLSAKLTGQQIPETLEAIDRLWKQYGDPVPTPRRFLDQALQNLYRDTTQLAQLFGVFAGVAGFLAALGLLGLSAFTAERRTKEIGIRKAMGASRADILRLLLWQFAKPVLWANVIAWPVGYYVMNRWLSGFAYHVDLEPWIFLAASGAALLIALLTVAGHALAVSRAKPVGALRYE